MRGADILRWILIGDLTVCLVAWLFLFRKAEVHPLIRLIPFYGLYRCYKIADSGGIFVASILVPLTALLPLTFETATGGEPGLFYWRMIDIAFILVLIMQIVYCRRLAHVFGKNKGYIFGLIFLHPVFLCLLAFGKTKYTCRKGFSGKVVRNGWVCPACGAVNMPQKAVCGQCGGMKPEKIPKWRTFGLDFDRKE